ncbi:MAG: hypothetical protein GF350_05025, partial [Chitinivibrionales bacterium]|nr:hypothetical protein [Chitinivibrionales bacterium]
MRHATHFAIICTLWLASFDLTAQTQDEIAALFEHRTLTSEHVFEDEADYNIYFPPDYAPSDRTYPIIFWLHGLGGNDTCEGTVNLPILDSLIRNDIIQPVISVLVDGGGNNWYRDMQDSYGYRSESYFKEEFFPHIDTTLPHNGQWALAGFSMGGVGSIEFGFKYPEMFEAIVSYDGAENDGYDALVDNIDYIKVNNKPGFFCYMGFKRGDFLRVTAKIDSVLDYHNID